MQQKAHLPVLLENVPAMHEAQTAEDKAPETSILVYLKGLYKWS
jgi:hypothetical protein